MAKIVLVTIATPDHLLTQERVDEFLSGWIEVVNIHEADFRKKTTFRKFRPVFEKVGERVYKPYVIGEQLKRLKAGDYLIYNDLYPGVWERALRMERTDFNLGTLFNMCDDNKGILAPLARWSDEAFVDSKDLGKATHKNFTSPEGMKKMKMEYPNSYLPSSSPWVFKKSAKATSFVKDWIEWTSDLEVTGTGGPMGSGYEQSAAGLLLAEQNMKMVIPSDLVPIHPGNFLHYCYEWCNYRMVRSRDGDDNIF